jgi:predicted transposase YbfD/YdcC
MLSVEESYYISTKIYSAKKSGKTIREHWWIENISHYVKDVSMWEDQSRIRVNPNIMSKMRSRGLNVLRTKWIKNVKRELSENKMDFYRFHKRYLRFI